MSGEGSAPGEGQRSADPSEAAQAATASSDVFISYASQDTAIADAVVEALERQGFRCWIAPRDVIPGEFYADSIVRALNAARTFVLVLTENAVSSPHVLREVERTSAKRHPIISFRVGSVALPPALEYFLSASHWLDASASDVDTAFPKLVAAVRRLIAHTSAVEPAHQTAAAAPVASLFPHPPVSTPALRRPLIALAAVIAVIVAYLGVDKLWLARQVTNQRPVAAAAPGRTVAVLPFRVLGSLPDEDYLGAGMADALTTRLSNIRQLTVRPTVSVLRYDRPDVNPVDAGRALAVDAVLAGEIQRAGEQIRVTVQLVNVASGAAIWAESFDQTFTNVFAVEDAISSGATAHLLVALTDQERARLTRHITNDSQAYQDYMKGRFLWDQDTEEPMLKSIRYFQNAIERDPGFALAYSGMADAYTELALQGYLPSATALPKAEQAASKALELDPGLAGPHNALGIVHWGFDWDWAAAEREFRRAAEIGPDDFATHVGRAFLLLTLKRFDTSIEEAKRAAQLNPASASTTAAVGYVHFAAGRFANSITWLKQAIDLNPNYSFPRALLAVDYALTQDPAAAASEYASIKDTARAANDPLIAAMSAFACAAAGNRPEALFILQKLKAPRPERYVDPYAVAIVYAGLGDDTAALDWLERTYEERSGSAVFFGFEPYMRALRANPRFIALQRRVGLPPY
jgi:TolB-like protein/tetratricopeptide (TPR) repeat protein